jgi:hypothetical protein
VPDAPLSSLSLMGAMMRPARNNAPAASAANVIRDAKWKGRQLFLGRKLLATIVPDNDWSDLYRVHFPNGIVTDLVNLTRAKDAAVALTCGCRQ